MSVSAFVRQKAMEPVKGQPAVRPELLPAAPENIGVTPSPSYEARVMGTMRSNGIPRRSAEILVKREMARER